MEVRDLDQEHLESVLKDDDDHGELPPSSHRTATSHHYASIARRPGNNRGEECNTSKERYSLLPDYAQESFVAATHETVETTTTPKNHSALLFQDLRQDVEPNLPKDIMTVGIFSLSDEEKVVSELRLCGD